MENIAIAIDGPASSGKSTVAKILAKEFGFTYTDTGAMYRSITYLALKQHISLQDEEKLSGLIEQYPITFVPRENGQEVFINEENVTEAIRQPEVTNAVSKVASFAKVRQQLVLQQQKIAEQGSVVMDGRDIGTAVLPKAQIKIFLVASVRERAERRYKENLKKGITTDFDTLKKEIQQRDYTDSHRSISPLRPAADAIQIDTTGMSIAEVVAAIKDVIAKKGITCVKNQLS